MKYQIVASDLDDTLLGDDGKVSPENWAAIEEMHKRGVHFVPASGRAYREMPNELLESPYIRYYITSDGCLIVDKETGREYEFAMPKAQVRPILDRLYQYSMCPMIHTGLESFVDAATHSEEDYKRFHMNRTWIDFTLTLDKALPDLRHFAYDCESVQAIIPFFENLSDLKECEAYFKQDPDLIVAQTFLYNLEIFSCRGGKGNALLHLADLLGVDRKSTIGVGDSTNDLTMVKQAGLGLAMENAVPELIGVCDEVICHYREHCAKFILEHFLAES